jgi:hypothetical protein
MAGSRHRRLNVAVTDLAASIVTVHVPVPVQAPLQPANARLPMTRAVSVTTVPLAKALLHVVPQSMPDGLLVTVPFELSEPFLVTLSVNTDVAALTVNANAFDAAAPGFSTVT